MPRMIRIARWMIVGAGLLGTGCDPGHKQAVRDKDPQVDGTSWSEPVIKGASKADSPSSGGDPEVEKAGIFGGSRLQGGLDEKSRDIERSLGVH